MELEVGGMTCASCAARVEKRLNRLHGVVATVNYATEKARVTYPTTLTPDDLIGAVEKAGYTARRPPPPDPSSDPATESGHDGTVGLGTRTLVSAALSVPVVALGMIGALHLPGSGWVALTLATPVVAWAAQPLHRAAWTALRHRSTTMDTLVSMGTVAAYAWSVYALVSGRGETYLEVSVAVTTFVLAGRYVEARAKRRAGAALRAMLQLGAREASLLVDGLAVPTEPAAAHRGGPVGAHEAAPTNASATVERRIPVRSLVVGDRFLVRPGEKIATDGVVVEGTSAIDAAVLTGESVPVEVGPGDAVTGATVNVGGRLVVRATRVGADTELARIAGLVTDAQTGKAQVQRLADRVSGVFVPVVIALAVATFAGWLAAGRGPAFAFTAAVAVLIVACPCALGLATPTALLVGTGRGAQLGILLKGPEVLESTRRVDTVVLDKTGTVTSGHMSVVDVVAGPGEDTAIVLRIAGALEDASEHPIGRAIAATAQGRFGALPRVSDFAGRAGLGVVGTVDGQVAVVGREQLLADAGLTVPPAVADAVTDAQARGATAVLVGWSGRVRGAIVVADEVRPTSARAVAELRRLGLRPVLLTGDHAAVARAVAADVGIDDVIAEVLPEGKADVITALQGQGRTVAMVGDGVNDAAALARADLGLALGTGTDAAIEAAEVTLVRADLAAAPDAVRLARRTLAVIKGNLFWAFAYNVAALPVAASGRLSPVVAGGAMALSSVFVVTNSLRLRRFR
ncbi:MAG: heavy metal translocating P-type ATPase [bacterium]